MNILNYKDYTINYIISKTNIHIVDSYKITKRDDMKAIIKIIRAKASENGFEYKRTDSSWVNEWRAHNFMYKYKIQKDRTGSVDLNENESRFRIICYFLMSCCYVG